MNASRAQTISVRINKVSTALFLKTSTWNVP